MDRNQRTLSRLLAPLRLYAATSYALKTSSRLYWSTLRFLPLLRLQPQLFRNAGRHRISCLPQLKMAVG